MVCRVKYKRFHGTQVAPDFGEAPSLMLEYWCWIKEELMAMSCHYTRLKPEYLETWQGENPGAADPPEKIPGELLDSLIESRHSAGAVYYLRQL